MHLPWGIRLQCPKHQNLIPSKTGIGAEFLIAAVDSFKNRRPGGEDISVVMKNVEHNDLPYAGKVTDNSDGTYSVTYSITVSSTYSVSITFNSVLAAGSPHTLVVQAQIADETLTYAYGNFKTIMTGRTHILFVQTRDRYGNYISSSPEEFPKGNDLIEFEYCSTLGETCEGRQGCVCNGGDRNPDVAIEVLEFAMHVHNLLFLFLFCSACPSRPLFRRGVRFCT